MENLKHVGVENLKHVGRLMYTALKVVGTIVAVTYALSLISAQDTLQGFAGLGLLLLVVFGGGLLFTLPAGK